MPTDRPRKPGRPVRPRTASPGKAGGAARPDRPGKAPRPKLAAKSDAVARPGKPARRVRADGSVAERAAPAHKFSGEPQRIAKLLARAGVASRREVERMIADGRVAIDGKTLDTPATILTDLAGVTVDGAPVAALEPSRLFLFHKPVGVLTAANDPEGRKTIYDRLPAADASGAALPRLMPVGRLDMNTEGLLLLTNDGELKRLLELPANGVERTYRARTFGDISQRQLESLMMGISIEGMNYGRIDANLERRTGRNQWVEMTLTEGKNREVRKVLEHFGLQVSRLIRTRYGPFTLGDAPPTALSEVPAADLEKFVRSFARKAPKKPPAKP